MKKTLSALCLAAGLAATAQASRLLDPVYLPSGNASRGLATGDLNGDGFADAVVANFGSATLIGAACPSSNGSLSVFFGSSKGLVAGPVLATGTDAPRGVALAPLRSAARLDILATFYCGGRLAIYSNNGDGTFSAPTFVTTGTQPVGVAALVGAGFGWVAVADYGSNDVYLYKVQQGALSLASTLAVGANPTDVKFYPIPGKMPALLVANFGASSVSRITLNADGSLAARVDIPVPGQPCKLAVGDLNNDGLPDLAVARFSDSAVSVFLGQADGSLAAAPTALALAGSHPNGIAFGRLGGAAALATADRDSDQVELLRWSPAGLSLCAAVRVSDAGGNTGTYGPVEAAIVDVNADGYGDVLFTHMRSGRLGVLAGAPPAAPAISSASHPDPAGWSASTSLRASFSAPAPDLDGIVGWHASLDQDPAGAPGATLVSSLFSQDGLSTGVHYLHAQSVDAAGKAGDVATYRVGVTAQLSKENTYNYPNPTHDGRTTIRFPLLGPADVSLKLYDSAGDLVWSRQLGPADTVGGVNTVEWDGRNGQGRPAGNGGYILVVQSGGITVTKKVAVLR